MPTTLNGASVSVTSGGKTVTPTFYYAVSTALGLVLPSTTPTGSAQVTVTYNGQTSAPYTIQVVQSAMGFDTYSGSSEVVAQNPTTGALYSYTNSVPQSALVALWGAGLGGDAAVDTTAVPGAFNINGLAHVYVGGIDAAIAYQGESGPGYPGVDEVFITIPANAPTGCFVSLVGVTSAGLPTNFTTIPIGTGACVETELRAHRHPDREPERADSDEHRLCGYRSIHFTLRQRERDDDRGGGIGDLFQHFRRLVLRFRQHGFDRRLRGEPDSDRFGYAGHDDRAERRKYLGHRAGREHGAEHVSPGGRGI